MGGLRSLQPGDGGAKRGMCDRYDVALKFRLAFVRLEVEQAS